MKVMDFILCYRSLYVYVYIYMSLYLIYSDCDDK